MTTNEAEDRIDKRAREIKQAVDQCRMAMADLVLADKMVALDHLRGWLEVELSTYDEAVIKGQRH